MEDQQCAAPGTAEQRVRLKSGRARDPRPSSRERAEHALAAAIIAETDDAIVANTLVGTVLSWNPAAAAMFGYSSEEMIGQPMTCLLPAGRLQEEAQLIAQVLQGKEVKHFQTERVRKDGAIVHVSVSLSPILGDAGRIVAVSKIARDVTDRVRMQAELDRLAADLAEQQEQLRVTLNSIIHRATHDLLTGLHNRPEFELRVEQAFATVRAGGSMHVLMYIDLDEFNIVNDICGHAVGDRILREVADLLRTMVRPGDVLARLGGDEFGVLLGECTLAQARRVGESLCERMDGGRFVHEDKRFRVGASIGMVPVDDRWATPMQLMVAADGACYAAKRHGRNRVHEWIDTDAMLIERHSEMRWASQIDQAIEEKRLRLYGQRIRSCSPVSPQGLRFEVLLRLMDQAGAVVSPGAFLPAAERFHLVSRLDRWVIREVIDRISSQKSARPEMVSINLSGHSLGDRSFHRYAAQLIETMPLDPAMLCLEITETAAITHLVDARDFIGRMRQFGVRIALDDFGTGVSSFGYLKSLPVDVLKIDGQFIRKVVDDPFDHTAVCCFRDLARICCLDTVAEFVESDAILDALREIGIDFAQGYAIHRPEPLDALLARGCTA